MATESAGKAHVGKENPAATRPRKSQARKKLENRVGRAIVGFVRVLLQALPRETAFRVGELLGDVLYACIPSRRRIMLRNLETAFGAELSAEERVRLARACARHLGRNLAEFSLLPAQPQGWLNENYDIIGRENLDEALARGKGVILGTGHLGNWELGGMRLVSAGYSLTVIARAMDDPCLESWVYRIRTQFGMNVVGRDDTRQVIRCLRNNSIVGILSDLNTLPGPNAVQVQFFGTPVLCPNGSAKLAMKTGAAIVPAAFYRKPDGRHVCELKPMLLADPAADEPEEEIRRLMQAISDHVEEAIRRHPEQWMWLNDRWRGIRQLQAESSSS